MRTVLVGSLFIALASGLVSSPAHADESASDNDPKSPSTFILESTGISFSVLESLIRRTIIRTRTPYGFKVKRVPQDSPGGRAGLKSGDVLLEWDGKPIRSVRELARWIEATSPQDEVTIRYARRKKPRRLGSRKPWETRDGVIHIAREESL